MTMPEAAQLLANRSYDVEGAGRAHSVRCTAPSSAVAATAASRAALTSAAVERAAERPEAERVRQRLLALADLRAAEDVEQLERLQQGAAAAPQRLATSSAVTASSTIRATSSLATGNDDSGGDLAAVAARRRGARRARARARWSAAADRTRRTTAGAAHRRGRRRRRSASAGAPRSVRGARGRARPAGGRAWCRRLRQPPRRARRPGSSWPAAAGPRQPARTPAAGEHGREHPRLVAERVVHRPERRRVRAPVDRRARRGERRHRRRRTPTRSRRGPGRRARGWCCGRPHRTGPAAASCAAPAGCPTSGLTSGSANDAGRRRAEPGGRASAGERNGKFSTSTAPTAASRVTARRARCDRVSPRPGGASGTTGVMVS